jgi:hypothetical protein
LGKHLTHLLNFSLKSNTPLYLQFEILSPSTLRNVPIAPSVNLPLDLLTASRNPFQKMAAKQRHHPSHGPTQKIFRNLSKERRLKEEISKGETVEESREDRRDLF